MKKLLLFAFCALTASITAVAEDETDPVTFRSNGILYMVNPASPSTVMVMNPADGYAEQNMSIPETAADEASGMEYTVTGIGPEAFMYAKTVSLSLPATISEIAGNAFFSAYYLKEIAIDEANAMFEAHDGVLYTKGMGKLVAFPSDKDAGSFTLPESVTELGDYAFCGVWLTAFEIPARITKIGRGAFMGTKLKEMVVPSTVKELKGAVFQNCGKLERIEFNNSMETFPDHTLTYCRMLKSIKLPDGITAIGDYAFDGAFFYGSSYGLVDEFVCPESVKYIGIGAFNANHGLKKVTFGAALEKINLYAFSNCGSLAEIVSLNTSVPECLNEDGGNDVTFCFNGVPESCVLYVPAESVEAYTAEWGAKFKDIRPIDTGGADFAEATAADFEIVVVNGELEVRSPSAVEIFNMAGMRVDGSDTGVLQCAPGKGCYVVRTCGKTVKVVL